MKLPAQINPDLPIPMEMEELLKSDSKELITLLNSFPPKIREVKTRLAPLIQRIESGNLDTQKGISLLDVKSHTLLSYITHLTQIILLKTLSLPICDSPSIDKLCELRTVLEKIKPLEQKLKYRIDKIVASAVELETRALEEERDLKEGARKKKREGAMNDVVEVTETNAQRFRPNLDSLMDESDNLPEKTAKYKVASEYANDNSDEDNTQKLYRPPKLVPMPYNDSTTPKSLSKNHKKTAQQSRMFAELRQQYSDVPEEISVEGAGIAGNRTTRMAMNSADQKWKNREAFEEEHFIRLNMTREDKKLAKSLRKGVNQIKIADEFTDLQSDFSNIAAINRAVEKDDEMDGSRGRRYMRHGNNSLGGGEKRKRDGDAGQVMSKIARMQMRQQGAKGQFDKAVKIQKKKGKAQK